MEKTYTFSLNQTPMRVVNDGSPSPWTAVARSPDKADEVARSPDKADEVVKDSLKEREHETDD